MAKRAKWAKSAGAVAAMARRVNKRRKWFLVHFLEHGSLGRAAAYAGVTVETVGLWVKKDADFAGYFADVKEAFAASLEAEAYVGGFYWMYRICFYRGNPIIHRRKKRSVMERRYSDRVLMFLLKVLKPEMYGGRVREAREEVEDLEAGRVKEAGVDGVRERLRNRRKRRFLRHFLEHGRFGEATVYAGVSVAAVQRWLRVDGEFARCFRQVREVFAECLEVEADRRGVGGVNRMRFYENKPVLDPRTKKVLFEKKYSDELLMFRLRGLKPGMHGEEMKKARKEVRFVKVYRGIDVERV
jgi:hypothetical protein